MGEPEGTFSLVHLYKFTRLNMSILFTVTSRVYFTGDKKGETLDQILAIFDSKDKAREYMLKSWVPSTRELRIDTIELNPHPFEEDYNTVLINKYRFNFDTEKEEITLIDCNEVLVNKGSKSRFIELQDIGLPNEVGIFEVPYEEGMTVYAYDLKQANEVFNQYMREYFARGIIGTYNLRTEELEVIETCLMCSSKRSREEHLNYRAEGQSQHPVTGEYNHYIKIYIPWETPQDKILEDIKTRLLTFKK